MEDDGDDRVKLIVLNDFKITLHEDRSVQWGRSQCLYGASRMILLETFV